MKEKESTIEVRVGRVCGVEIRKGLPQEPAELINAIIIGQIHPQTWWSLLGSMHPSLLSINNISEIKQSQKST